MTFEKKEVSRMPREFEKARKDFQEALSKNKQLGYLLLVDPVRAFADAGITLSTETRKHLRRQYPDFPYGNKKLYKAVKARKVQLPWITSVKFHFETDETDNPK